MVPIGTGFAPAVFSLELKSYSPTPTWWRTNKGTHVSSTLLEVCFLALCLQGVTQSDIDLTW
jgi:hypothetical protein